MNRLDKLDITIQHRDHKVFASIRSLRLHACADTADGALRELERQKSALVTDLKAAGLLEDFAKYIVDEASRKRQRLIAAVILLALIAIASATYFGVYGRSSTAATSLSLPDGGFVSGSPKINGVAEVARISNDNVIISGWATDLSGGNQSGLVDFVRVFVDGELGGEVSPKTGGPNVRRVYTDGKIASNWFNVSIASSTINRLDDVRVFAGGATGWAELKYGTHYPFPHTRPEWISRELALLIGEVGELRASRHNGDVQPQSKLRLDYKGVGQTTAIIPTIIGAANPFDGAAVLSPSFTPSRPCAKFELHVQFNGLVTESNEFVLAVFRTGSSEPILLATRTAAAGRLAEIDQTSYFQAKTAAKVELQVRVGLAQPRGILYLNSNPNGPPEPGSYVEIRELPATEASCR